MNDLLAAAKNALKTLDELYDKSQVDLVEYADLRAAVEKNDNLPPDKTYADLIPTNWLDPLLTGSDAVIHGYTFTPKDIERLLLAIRARMERAQQKTDAL